MKAEDNSIKSTVAGAVAVENQAYASNSRATLLEALRTNIRETGSTLWYGLVGIATVSDFTLFKDINGWVTAALVIVPSLSRDSQISEMARDEKNVMAVSIRYYAKVGARALLGLSMFGIAAATASYTGLITPAAWLLGTWCAAKILHMGDASPLGYLQNFFNTKKPAASEIPKGRETFLNSLSKNISDSIGSIYYSVIAIGASPLTTIQSLTLSPPVAGLLAIVPLVSRLSQIEKMSSSISSPISMEDKKAYRAEALLNTLFNVATGVVVFTVATLASHPANVACGLAGWSLGKLTSAGANSPVQLLGTIATTKFSTPAVNVTAKLASSAASDVSKFAEKVQASLLHGNKEASVTR